jgi:hypothetical protein
LGYAFNTFAFKGNWQWAEGLVKAHRDVVTDVIGNPLTWHRYAVPWSSVKLTEQFPGLRRIHFPEDAYLPFMTLYSKSYDTKSWNWDQWRKWVQNLVNAREKKAKDRDNEYNGTLWTQDWWLKWVSSTVHAREKGVGDVQVVQVVFRKSYVKDEKGDWKIVDETKEAFSEE